MKKNRMLISFLLCILIGSYSCEKDTPAVNPESDTNNKTALVIEDNNAIIDSNTEWKDLYGGDTIDYIIKTQVRVIKNAVLTIKPGVLIAFETAESGIRVEENGGLDISGTINKQIVLTSRNRTDGAWKGITFATNNPANKLSYARVLYAGGMKDAGFCDSLAAIVLAKNHPAKVSITNTYIANSGGYGIWAAGSDNSDLTFSHDTVLCYIQPPLAVTANNMYRLDSTSYYGFSNITNIDVIGGEINDADTIQCIGAAYRILGRVYVNNTLTISPGCIFEFNKTGELTTTNMSGTNHNGVIKAIGTMSSHIVFRGVEQQPGSWVGITITSAAANELRYCDISSGGSSGGYQNPSSVKGNIIVGRNGTGAIATIKNCNISSSAGYGIAKANNSSVYTTSGRPPFIIETNTYDSNSSGNIGSY